MGQFGQTSRVERSLKVEVWFDLICPWCWIGKHSLDRARRRLAQSDPDVRLQVVWHSVQLIPQVPLEGWPFDAFYEHRLGSRAAVLARRAQVQAAAQRAGTPIDYTRITLFPNTTAAHQLLAAGRAQLTPEVLERLLHRLLEGYFVRGDDLGSVTFLTAVATEFGVNYTPQPNAGLARDETMPATGVPYFLIDGTDALSGAQPDEVLWTAMRLARGSSLATPA